MGSLFTPKVPAPPAPPPDPAPNTIVDNINKTISRPVKNADGTYTITYDQQPLSAEEQAYQDMLTKTRDESLGWINKISTDPNYQSDYVKQYLKDYEATGIQGIDKAYKARADFEETNLARNGIEDSTAATEARQARGNDMSSDVQQLGRDMSGIAQQARDDQLNKALTSYGLATGRQDAQLAQLTQSIAQGNSMNLGLTGLKQQRDLAVYDAQNKYTQLKANASAVGKQTMGQIVGMAAGAAMGGFGGFGASSGITGGFDPRTGITWNSGRVLK